MPRGWPLPAFAWRPTPKGDKGHATALGERLSFCGSTVIPNMGFGDAPENRCRRCAYMINQRAKAQGRRARQAGVKGGAHAEG